MVRCTMLGDEKLCRVPNFLHGTPNALVMKPKNLCGKCFCGLQWQPKQVYAGLLNAYH